jgi:tetratricopeptide (TPR) repeat protein
MPSALEKLDGVRVAWWRKHVFHIGPWLFAARALILLVVCSLALSTVRIPPPERSRFQELRAAAYATPADRVAARQLCKLAAQKTPPLSGQVSTGLRADLLDSARHDCSYAHQLMPDSLLIRQYQAIIELKAGNISRAANYFDEILAVSPLDSAALFGKGLALQRARRPISTSSARPCASILTSRPISLCSTWTPP